MNVTINKTDYELAEGATINDALQTLPNIPNKGIAVALNNDVVASSLWATTTLHNGDKLTIIKAFYGG